MPVKPSPEIQIFPQAKLSHYTTFKLGGPCPVLIECATMEGLIDAVRQLNTDHTPFILIGGGSNLVVADQGLNTAVIRFISPTPLIERKDNMITVTASTFLDDLALFCVDQGLGGMIFTSGIPGTVGGAVVGNAGAWGKQVGDILTSAQIMDKQGHVKTVERDYFGFTYRNSRLKETDEIVLQATFTLHETSPVDLAKERADILKLRAEKHPNLTTHPCAGSFFRNIEPTSKAEKRQASGWFLEQAGGKSLKSGGAQIYDKHANIIVKGPGCKAQDVYDLHLLMIEAVKQKFGFLLNREVRFVGKFENALESNAEGFW